MHPVLIRSDILRPVTSLRQACTLVVRTRSPPLARTLGAIKDPHPQGSAVQESVGVGTDHFWGVGIVILTSTYFQVG